MKAQGLLIILIIGLSSQHSYAWDAKVTRILQHGDTAAVYLSPDPGKQSCETGSPYILIADDSVAAKQRFSMLLTAMTAGLGITGHDDECSSAIWGISRPTIRRLYLNAN